MRDGRKGMRGFWGAGKFYFVTWLVITGVVICDN